MTDHCANCVALDDKLSDIAAKASVAADVGTCERVRQAICEDIERLAASSTEPCGTCKGAGGTVVDRFSMDGEYAGQESVTCSDCVEGVMGDYDKEGTCYECHTELAKHTCAECWERLCGLCVEGHLAECIKEMVGRLNQG